MIFLVITCASAEESRYNLAGLNFRELMRDFVIKISGYAKAENPDFIVIPQNGIQLISMNGRFDGPPAEGYLDAIDGAGQEDLFYGYDYDDEPTPEESKRYILGFLNIAESRGLKILVIDYCNTPDFVDDSYYQGSIRNFITYAADSRNLNTIPDYPEPIFNNNNSSVTDLPAAKNFLYIINADSYRYKTDFLNAVKQTDYDIVIVDLFFQGNIILSEKEVESIKTKPSGKKRLVIAYMSIGEAEDYRYYWKKQWSYRPPVWLGDENPEWEGNYKVHYWEPEWQGIIFGSENSYLDKILEAGFDGVYLDIIDAFQYYE